MADNYFNFLFHCSKRLKDYFLTRLYDDCLQKEFFRKNVSAPKVGGVFFGPMTETFSVEFFSKEFDF